MIIIFFCYVVLKAFECSEKWIFKNCLFFTQRYCSYTETRLPASNANKKGDGPGKKILKRDNLKSLIVF
jgi:hypothetical protein